MTISYEKIFTSFLSRITDYKFASLNIDDANSLMVSWLHNSVKQPYLRRLFNTIDLQDDILLMTYELKNSVDDDNDQDFVIELLSKGMVIEWLEPQVTSVANIAQVFGGKDQKFYAQANHLSVTKELLNEKKTELRKFIRDRGYIYNSYINE